AELSSINPQPKACHCLRRRSLATECWTTTSSHTLSLPLEKSVDHMAVSSSCWLSLDNGEKRSLVYSGQSWISRNEYGHSPPRATCLDDPDITDQERKGLLCTPVLAIDGCAVTRRPARSICLLSARNQALPGIQSSKTSAGSALGGDGVAPSRLAPDLRIRDGPAGHCASCRG